MSKMRKLLGVLGIAALVFQLGAPIAQATHNAGVVHVTSSNIIVQDITRTTATVCFSLSGSGYGKIYYGQTTAYGQTFQEEAASSCGKILRLSGLAAGTMYNFKIVSWPASSSEMQDGESSSNLTFTTPSADTIAPGNVADGKANLGSAATMSSSYDSVTFNWKVPGDDGWTAGAGPARYFIRYQKRGGTLFQGPNDGGFWYTAQELSATSSRVIFAPSLGSAQMGVTQALTINGHEASTQYRFGVLSVDAAGNQSTLPGIWDINTTTAPATDTFAPAPVTFLTATSTTVDSIALTWTSPWDPGINSVPQAAARYEVRYKVSPITTEAEWQSATLLSGAPNPKPGNQSETFTITGLSNSTAYTVAIRAYDTAGNVSPIASTSATTKTPPPIDTTAPVLNTIVSQNLTKNSADIAFTLDETSYVKVEYSMNGGITLTTPEVNTTITDAVKNGTVYLTNLTQNSIYQYQVIARNSANLTSRSALYTFQTKSETASTTPVIVPPPSSPAPIISFVKTTNVYSTGADISFNTDISGYARLEYGTSMSYGSFTQWTGTANTTHYISLPNLSPDTIYYARVQANSVSGVGASIMPTLSFKTLSGGQMPPIPPPPGPPPTNNTLQSGTAGLIVIVKSSDGTPVEGSMVGLSEKSSPYRWASGQTNSAGEYTFPKTIAGQYMLGLGSPPQRTDLEGVSMTVTLVDGTTINQSATLPKRNTPTPNPNEALFIYNVMSANPSDDGTAIYVTWTTNKASTSRVEYGITSAMTSSMGEQVYTSNHSVYLKGLDPKTIYYFKVSSTDSLASTTFSPQYTLQTSSQSAKIPFAINYQTLFPAAGARDIPLTSSQIHVEFSRPIDTNTVPQSVVDMRVLGDTRSLSGLIQTFSNGFDYKLLETLKPNTTYSVTIRGVIRDTAGTQLERDYFYTFTTANADGGGSAIFKGIVKNANGVPIPDANVRLTNTTYSFNTDINTTAFGEFHFSNLKPDIYLVYVYPPTYGEYSFYSQKPLTISLSANETKVQDVLLENTPEYYIKGSVVFNDTKTGVTDAEVIAYKKDGRGAVSAEVNAQGEYCMVVSAGTWMLSVSPRNTYILSYDSSYRGPSRSPCGKGLAPVARAGILRTAQFSAPSSSVGIPKQIPFHGNWYWRQSPQEITVGQQTSPVKVANFEVTRMSVTKISGRVVRADGLQITPGSVLLRLLGAADARPMSIPVSSFDGKFESAVAPGTYKLFVEVTEQGLASPQLPTISLAEGETKDIGTITLGEANLIIQGKVTTETGDPVARIKIGARKQSTSETSFAATDESGSYTLKVSEGEWIVGVVPTPDQQYTMIEAPRTVRVEKGKQATANFTLALNNSIVTGLVKSSDGAILTDFFGYVVVRLKEGSQMPMAGTPVERGQFTLRLKKGEYILSLEVPANTANIPTDPINLTIAAGEQKNVSFTTNNRRATVIGKLINENGVPVTGIPYKVFTTGPNGSWYSADVNTETGEYKLAVGPGTWLVDYEIGQYDEYEKVPFRGAKIILTNGEEKKLDFSVRKTTAMIRGKAMDASGDAVPNVWVAFATDSFSRFSEKSAKDLEYLNGMYTDKNGAFELKIRAGTYFVRSFLPPSFGLINPEEQKISVKGGKIGEVSLVFRPISVSISGITTVNGKPSWAYVWAWSDTGGYTDTTSAGDGSYTLKVAPNDAWHIAALSEQQRNAYKSSETVLTVGGQSKLSYNIDLASLNVKLPDPVSVSGEADQLSVVSNTQGVKLAVPANAASTNGTLTLSITPEVLTPSQGSSRVVGFGYDIAVRTATGREINAFNSDLTVTVPYDPKETSKLGLKASDLSLQYWDETRYSWQAVRNAVVNENDHTITCSINHLTRFAIVAATKTTPPPAPKSNIKIQKKGVLFSWDLGKDKAKIKYLKLYRSDTKGVLGKVILNNLTGTGVTDTKVKTGAQYFYTIRTVDIYGNESINTKQVAVKTL